MDSGLDSGVAIVGSATHKAFAFNDFPLWSLFLGTISDRSHLWFLTRPGGSLLSLYPWVIYKLRTGLGDEIGFLRGRRLCLDFRSILLFVLTLALDLNYLLWLYRSLKLDHNLLLFYNFLHCLFGNLRSCSLLNDVYLNVLIFFCHINPCQLFFKLELCTTVRTYIAV